MSVVTIAVPKEYGYVVAVTVASFFLNTYLGIRVSPYRRAAKVAYPKNQADSGDVAAATTPEAKQALYLFNCAQRGHLNYVENQASAMGAMLIAGVDFPLTAAGLGAAWLVTRVWYALGYTSTTKKDGAGRVDGFKWSILAQWSLYAMSGWTAFKIVR